MNERSLPEWLADFIEERDAQQWNALGWLRAADDRRFLLRRRLGKGGMGSVYLTIDSWTGHDCALKVSPRTHTDRIEQEIAWLSRLQHPNVVRLVDEMILEPADGSAPLRAFLMEYISGGSLHQLIKKKSSLPLKESLRILGDLSTCLSYLRTEHLRHRDLKPENILLDASANRIVKIADFGLIKRTEVEFRSIPAFPVGTYNYAAPEVWDDPENTNDSVDYFALGCILHEMLTGVLAFNGKTVHQIKSKIKKSPPACIEMIKADYGDKVDALVNRLLDKDPVDRLTDPEEIQVRIAEIRADPKRNNSAWKRKWLNIDDNVQQSLLEHVRAESRFLCDVVPMGVAVLIGQHTLCCAYGYLEWILKWMQSQLWLQYKSLQAAILSFDAAAAEVDTLTSSYEDYIKCIFEISRSITFSITSQFWDRFDSESDGHRALARKTMECLGLFEQHKQSLGEIPSRIVLRPRCVKGVTFARSYWARLDDLRQQVGEKMKESSESLVGLAEGI